MKKEIEYLQSAFESYKSQLHFETDERWKAKEDELRAQCEEDLDKKIDKLRECFTERTHSVRFMSANKVTLYLCGTMKM